MNPKIEIPFLIQMAIQAKRYSYSPYSHFEVGSAILTKSGKIYTGCNIESASYSPTNCAERTALFKAVSEGEKEFLAVAVVGATKEEEISQFVSPCGVCRQMLYEFGGKDLLIILAKNEAEYQSFSLGELLPFAFGPENLK